MTIASKSNQRKLASKKAHEFNFKSFLDAPISELSLNRRALLFAEISMISYLAIDECNIAAGQLGFTDGKFFNHGASQAYWFQNEFDSVVVCRGTEAREWDDIKVDANALTAIAETVGKVHRGFKSEIDAIWPYMEKELEKNDKSLWFCGHSLGAAMAKICAGRCMLSYIKTEPEELHTYGSPRVGCRRYVNHVKLDHYRWVNNNDIVTRIPPVWLNYRHSGAERYFDRFGRLKKLNGWRRVSDRFRGFVSALRRGKIDQLADHSIVAYIDNIFEMVRNETPPVQSSASTSSANATQSAEPNPLDASDGGLLQSTESELANADATHQHSA